MSKKGKKYVEAAKLVDKTTQYEVQDAVRIRTGERGSAALQLKIYVNQNSVEYRYQRG